MLSQQCVTPPAIAPFILGNTFYHVMSLLYVNVIECLIECVAGWHQSPLTVLCVLVCHNRIHHGPAPGQPHMSHVQYIGSPLPRGPRPGGAPVPFLDYPRSSTPCRTGPRYAPPPRMDGCMPPVAGSWPRPQAE